MTLLVAGSALAQSGAGRQARKAATATSSNSPTGVRRVVLDFEHDLVLATLERPRHQVVDGLGRGAGHKSLIRVREGFGARVLGSAGDL